MFGTVEGFFLFGLFAGTATIVCGGCFGRGRGSRDKDDLVSSSANGGCVGARLSVVVAVADEEFDAVEAWVEGCDDPADGFGAGGE